MSQKVLIFGSVAFDTVETPFGKRENMLGGSATYAALSASYFTSPVIISAVGKDFPDKYRRFLRERKVSLENVETKEGKSFYWKARYGKNPNEREVLTTCENVLGDYSPNLLPEYQNVKYLFLANNSPSSQLYLLQKMRAVEFVLWDTMDFWIERYPDEILKILPRVDIALFNDSEAQQFSGEFNLLKAAKKILALGLRRGVIIKKGEHGAFLYTPSFVFSAPAYLLEEVKDPTGAGDSFAGGLIGYLAGKGNISERNLKKSLIYGTIMASFTVEEFGVEKFNRLREKDIEERYQELKKLTQF
ncbi:MAG TPA: sugar kinase [Candidatus Omnitrophica bacterium]|nr:sugar kinase [Candidatus Omnitrophota bacterium]